MAEVPSTTLVTFPAGAVRGRSRVLAAHALPDGSVGLVTEQTPFHPLDHSWPDQPADCGTAEIDGVVYPVIDCLTGAYGPAGEFALGAAIPVKRGDEAWTWVVVHLVEALPAPGAVIGHEVTLSVDTERRHALSAAHTGCHLFSLALNEALADRWREPADGGAGPADKGVRTDPLGNPDFDSAAMESSRMDVAASTDRYRIGKSLRRKGFQAEGLREALPRLTAQINARLTAWVSADAQVRVDAQGPALTDRREWVCELPRSTAAISCGGTHLSRLGEVTAWTAALSLSEDGAELLAVTTPKRP
jgi:alanyl-tRNA synthetase